MDADRCVWIPSMGTELQLSEICPRLPYIPSFCPATQPTYVTEDVNSLFLAGKCCSCLPHSSRKAYTQTGLIPQGFNDEVFKVKQTNKNRQDNSLSIAWEIWLHSHA